MTFPGSTHKFIKFKLKKFMIFPGSTHNWLQYGWSHISILERGTALPIRLRSFIYVVCVHISNCFTGFSDVMAECHGYGWRVECWEHGCWRGDANLKFHPFIFKRGTCMHLKYLKTFHQIWYTIKISTVAIAAVLETILQYSQNLVYTLLGNNNNVISTLSILLSEISVIACYKHFHTIKEHAITRLQCIMFFQKAHQVSVFSALINCTNQLVFRLKMKFLRKKHKVSILASLLLIWCGSHCARIADGTEVRLPLFSIYMTLIKPLTS